MNEYIRDLDELIRIAQTEEAIGTVGGKPYFSINFDILYTKFIKLFDKMADVSYEELEEENEELYEENNALKDEIEFLEKHIKRLLENTKEDE